MGDRVRDTGLRGIYVNRSIEGRIAKLEARTGASSHPEEFLLIWHMEGDDPDAVAERSRELFGPNDQVAICPWLGTDMPAPRWISTVRELSDAELDRLVRYTTSLARSVGAIDEDDMDRVVVWQRAHLADDPEVAFSVLRAQPQRSVVRL
jgi:hypothetical protein